MESSSTDKIHQLIRDYQDLDSDSTAIPYILDIREKLAGELFFLSTILGKRKRTLLMAEFNYKKKWRLSKMSIIVNQDTSASYGEALSKANAILEKEAMSKADANFNELKFEMDAAKEVMAGMAQRISYMKMER